MLASSIMKLFHLSFLLALYYGSGPSSSLVAAQGEAIQEGKDCTGSTVSVGCVLKDREDIPCADYIPNTAEKCHVQVKYTYYVRQSSPPTGIILNSMIRTRETAHPTFGNPRNYKESSWGSEFTPPEMTPYEMNTWEGEYVNFCESSSVETTFEVDTSVCVTTGVYTLETSDVFPDVTLPMFAEEQIPEDGKIIENIETVMDDTSAAFSRAIPILSLVAIVGMCILW